MRLRGARPMRIMLLGLASALLLCVGIPASPAGAHGLPDQVSDACSTFAYATDPCDCDTGDPELCCMGQEFSPGTSTLTGFDLQLRGGPDVDPNAPFSTFVTVNVRMRTILGPMLGSAT